MRREADLFWASLTGEPLGSPVTARGGYLTRAPGPPRLPASTARLPVPVSRAYEDDDSLSEALPAGPTASPCDIAKTSETLDGFGTNSSTPTAAHRATINTIAGCLLALRAGPRPIRNVDIAGFTDPSGNEPDNVRLGQSRAAAVRDALVAALNGRTAGSAANFTFRLRSGGELTQMAGGDAANRRVEVSVEIAITDIVVHASDTNTHEIASNLGAAGLEHFCCVKTTGDIILEALVSPNVPGAIGGRLTWAATGTAIASPGVGTDGRTAKLSSAATGKFPIRLSWDGAVARQAVVWVIWSGFEVTCTRQPRVVAFPVQVGIRAGVDHTFGIDPPQIITDVDRPALDGPPTAAVPGAALRHSAGGTPLGGGAAKKWDMSRQVRVRVLNPRLYPAAQLPPIDPLGHLWNGQPTASTIPENYPADTAIGNDDSNSCDETNNPYENCGIVTSIDSPTIAMLNTTGADGDTFEMHIHFREFLRVNLGTTWYRASDFSRWRFHPRFIRAGGVWTNNASTFALDNAGF